MKFVKYILAGAFCLAFGVAEAAYGLKWKPGDDEAVAGAYLTAVNAFELRMRQPDGKIRTFRRDFAEPSKLYGDEPWVGEDMGGGMFRILTNPEFMGGRTGYVFQNGHLRRMVLGRKDYQFEQMPYPASTNNLESLWPAELTKEEAIELFSTWKGDDGRLRIGYVNPNKGGCLMAEVVLLGLALLLLAGARHKFLMALGAVIAAGGFWVLTMTASRSAFVAVVVGAAVLVAFRARSLFSWKRLCIALAVVGVGVGVVMATGVGERFTSGLVDAQGEVDSLRVNILKAAPHMMVDAPRGWGSGISGSAYANWYQAPDEFRTMRTLINSHLTWLVELGWTGRALYLWGVFALVAFLCALAARGASPLPAALFIAFFTAALFNSVMEAPTLWIIPGASLALFLLPAGRKALSRGVALLSLGIGLVLSGAVLGALIYLGSGSEEGRPKLYAEKGKVIVNGDASETWVLDDSAVLGAGFLGRELRMFYAAFPQGRPMGLVWNLEDLPADAKNVIVAGRKCRDFVAALEADAHMADKYASITFISPPFAASDVPAALAGRPGFRMMQGELAVRLTPDYANPPPFLTIVPGAELYIPGWMQLTATGNK